MKFSGSMIRIAVGKLRSRYLLHFINLHRLSFSHALAATFCLILEVCDATNLFLCLSQRPGGRIRYPRHGRFWEKTVDNGNKLFAVCTPTAAEQDGADLSPVWSFRLVVVPRCQAIHSTRVVCLSFAPV